MKKHSLSICCVTLLAILALAPAWSQGREIPEPQTTIVPVKILQFLKGSEMQKHRATFTGEIDPIPENLKALLMQHYLHRFTIVRMRLNRDISFTTSELIVVSDATTGDVVSHLWQGGYDVPETIQTIADPLSERYWVKKFRRIEHFLRAVECPG